jgi:hypothetical protein
MREEQNQPSVIKTKEFTNCSVDCERVPNRFFPGNLAIAADAKVNEFK